MCTLCTIFEAFKTCLCVNFSKKINIKNTQKPDYFGKHSGLKLGFINDHCSLYLFFLFIYLAVLGLSCSTQTLSCSMWDLAP